MTVLWLFVLFSIIASGLFSGAESAFIACPRLRIRHLARKGLPSALRMEKAQANPNPYLTTLLVGTNLAIIGGTVAATRIAEDMFPGHGEIAATLVLSPVFLLFSEVLPKSYFLAHTRSMCLQIVPPLEFLRRLFWPLVVVAGAPALLMSSSKSEHRLPVTREELILLTRLGTGRPRLSQAAGHVLEKELASRKPLASELMVPRKDVMELPADARIQDAYPTIRATRYSRYPLEREGTWIGVVHVLDLTGSPGTEVLDKLSHPIPCVDSSAGLEEILGSMRDAGEHMLAVVDRGRHIGVITLDDILDHLTAGLDSGTAV